MPSRGVPALKLVPKPWAALLFPLLLAGVVLLFAGRRIEALRPALLLQVLPGFYDHVSNFSISWLLLASVGYFWLMMGVGIKPVAWLAVAIVACNLVYEAFIPLVNTRDMVDAAYGAIGTAAAFATLLVIRCGLVPNPAHTPG